MATHAELHAEPNAGALSPRAGTPGDRGGGRYAWHALATLFAAAVGWLVFAAYRQPEFIVNLAGMRLC